MSMVQNLKNDKLLSKRYWKQFVNKNSLVNPIIFQLFLLGLIYLPKKYPIINIRNIQLTKAFIKGYEIPLWCLGIIILFTSIKYFKLILNHFKKYWLWVFPIGLYILWLYYEIVNPFNLLITILLSPLFVLNYLIGKWVYFNIRNKSDQNKAKSYDEAISSASEDKLNRLNLKDKVISIISNVQQNESIRIGIYGQWGEGKTSLLNLIKEECIEEDYITVSLNPWLYKNIDELWTGFRIEFEKSFNIYKPYMPFFFKFINLFNLSRLHPKAPKLPIGDLIEQLFKQQGNQNIKSKINNHITNLYSNKKIVIFVDDLDRIDDFKEIIEILKGIKQIMDIKNTIFIIAIDQSIVADVIKKGFNDVIDGYKFLEKIIDYPIFLGLPIDQDLDILIESLSENEEINKHRLDNLRNYLPSNPRTLKRYLKSLKLSLSSLKKFSEKTNWEFLYLAHLLCLEFPDIFRKIVTEQEYQEVFIEGWAIRNEYKNQERNVVEEIINQTTEKNRGRLKVLIKGLQDRGVLSNEVLFYFLAIESDEMITANEFLKFFNEIEKGESPFKDINHIKRYLLLLVNQRENIISSLSNSITKKEMLENVELIIKYGEQILSLIEQVDNDFHIIIFRNLFNAMSRKFIDSDLEKFNCEVVKQNADILYKIMKKSGESQLPRIYEILQTDLQINEKKSQFFNKLKNELADYLKAGTFEIIIRNLRIKDGIKNLTMSKLFFWSMQDENFPNNHILSELKELVAEAKNNNTIIENFYDFFIRLLYDQELFKKKEELTKIIWEGMISQELSPYMKNTLEEQFLNIENSQGVVFRDTVAIPEWWK
jgi:hypothetical protein